MAEAMYVLTITEDEWKWLNQAACKGSGAPDSMRFAIESVVLAQTEMTYSRNYRENRPTPTIPDLVDESETW